MQAVPVPILINGHSYEWADIQLAIAGGTPVAGITEINYEAKRNIQNIYGIGSEPVSRGYGAKEYSASITIKWEEVQALIALAPDGDITQIPTFTITVAWLDTENAIVQNTLQNVKFADNSLKTKQGDTSTDITLNLVIAGILYF
jgi:hypothetical protein